MPLMPPDHSSMEKTALLSDCTKYRYRLGRRWDDREQVLFIMLNPSTADANMDDPTIRRCIGFAKAWGYGGMQVGNLFPFRSPKPMELLNAGSPHTDENLDHLGLMAAECAAVVCAWGNGEIVRRLMSRVGPYDPIAGIEKPLNYIELCKDGTPKHPLYLKGGLELKPLDPKGISWR